MPKLSFLRQIASDETGAASVELGLILAMIVLAMFTALTGFANELQATWNTVNTQVTNASQAAAA